MYEYSMTEKKVLLIHTLFFVAYSFPARLDPSSTFLFFNFSFVVRVCKTQVGIFISDLRIINGTNTANKARIT